jgi:hypothetical protein
MNRSLIKMPNITINPNRGLTTSSKNVHLDYGELVHIGLATYFKALQDGFLINNARKLARDTLKNEFAAKDIEHKVKTLEAAVFFLNSVVDLNLQDEGDILSVEEMYTMRLPSGVIYRGKIDLLLGAGDGTIVIDWKTKGRLPSAYFHHISLDRQLKGYAMLASTKRCDLVILHCITKPQIYRHSSMYEEDELALWLEETNHISINIQTKLKFAQLYYNNGNFDEEMPTWNMLFPRAATVCQTWGCKFFTLCSQGRYEDAIIDIGIFKPKEPRNGSSESGSKVPEITDHVGIHVEDASSVDSCLDTIVDTTLAISHSQIYTLMECPASFFWQYAFPWSRLPSLPNIEGDINVLEP